jgi:ATP-dependent Clp protease ATP-binding subunit ClpB
VVLFAEIEKAHQDVFNILLQILDDGRLTDSQGRTVDFRNTVIIMASNIGGQYILDYGTSDWARAEERVMEALRQHFKPEFLNRVDDIIMFNPLAREQIGRIVDIQLQRMERLLADRNMTPDVTPDAKTPPAQEGFEPVYGARPLKRAIQKHIQNPLAMAVLEGRFHDGDHIVVTRAAEGGLQFEKVEAAAGAPAGATAGA